VGWGQKRVGKNTGAARQCFYQPFFECPLSEIVILKIDKIFDFTIEGSIRSGYVSLKKTRLQEGLFTKPAPESSTFGKKP